MECIENFGSQMLNTWRRSFTIQGLKMSAPVKDGWYFIVTFSLDQKIGDLSMHEKGTKRYQFISMISPVHPFIT